VRHLWIRPHPSSKAWIGYLSLGDSTRVKDGDAVAARVEAADGRCGTWYEIEPTGYVCVGKDATLDSDDPDIVALRKRAADRSSPWPYRYGESLGTPVYPVPPTLDRQRRRELDLDEHLDKVARATSGADPATVDARFAGMDFSPAGKGPPRLLDLPAGGRALQTAVVRGSTIAYVDSFDHQGRTYLLTWDGSAVPKDRVRPYPASQFQGVVLGQQAELPIAFFRVGDGTKYRRDGDTVSATDDRWPRLSWVSLSGDSADVDGARYHATVDGTWCADADVTIARRSHDVPKVVANQTDGRRSWLDVSIEGGTLVAYEDATPVYATLVSPGRGGMPHPGVDPLDTASTPTGTYAITGKFLTATMQSGSIATLIHAEVQYTMNFSGPYAIHGAYWHDRWGQKMSGGCVNLSPVDSQRIFEWSQPRLPAGWHGMATITTPRRFAHPTWVHLHR